MGKARVAWLLGAAGVAAMLAGCEDMSMRSFWAKQAVTVDGDDAEWAQVKAANRAGLDVKAVSDGQNLWLCLKGGGTEVRKQLRQGLNLWIAPKGGHEKVKGIQLAMAPQPGRKPGPALTPGQGFAQGLPTEQAGAAPAGMDRPNTATAEAGEPGLRLVWQGMEGYPKALTTGAREAEMVMKASHGVVVVEARIPLKGDFVDSFALDSRPGGRVVIGLETVANPEPGGGHPQGMGQQGEGWKARDGRQDGAMGMGGPGGMGHGEPGGHQGPGQGREGFEPGGASTQGGSSGQESRPDNLELWIDLELAQASDSGK